MIFFKLTHNKDKKCHVISGTKQAVYQVSCDANMMETFKCWMYWAKSAAATAIKTYESQTGSNINWQAHGITNNKNS